MSIINKANKVYKISGMNCPSCAMLIESEFDDLGIKTRVSFAKETIEIKDENYNYKKIKEVLTSLGYSIE